MVSEICVIVENSIETMLGFCVNPFVATSLSSHHLKFESIAMILESFGNIPILLSVEQDNLYFIASFNRIQFEHEGTLPWPWIT
jgi:hypothetical protein